MTSPSNGRSDEGGFLHETGQYEGYVDRLTDGVIIGWVRRIASAEPLRVGVYSNGTLVASGIADQHRQDLQDAGKGNGRHAFSLAVPRDLPLGGLRVEAAGIWDVPFSFALRIAMDSSVELAAAAAKPARRHSGLPTVWIDISDFLFYLSHHKSVSGIQRVQCEIIRSIILNGWTQYAFCITTPECIGYHEVPEALLSGLLARLDVNASVPEAEWVSYVSIIADTARLPQAGIAAGDMLFLLGAFWVYPGIPHLLAALRGRGVHIGVYVYDLIPLYYPEYCDIGLIRIFVRSFALIAGIADLILTISRHTADEVSLYYRRTRQPQKTIRPVPLAHELRHGAQAEEGGAADTARLLQKIGAPYVLCVCTIEVRKNHTYLFRIWRELLRRHGKQAVPKLVLVGRRGWRVDDFFAQLEATRHLDGHVVILSGLDNAELEALYKHCLFTVFPSYNEGWGLPVGESLVYGKLCVASRATSIPEVGGRFAAYIDPDNVTEGLQTIERIVLTPGLREQAEATIRAEFVPRSWDEVARTFAAEVGSHLQATAGQAAVPPGRLRCGVVASLGRSDDLCSTDDILRDDPCRALICTEGWHPPEDWGVWGRGRSSAVAFTLEPKDRRPPARLRVYLKLRVPEGRRAGTLRVTSACGASGTLVLSGKPTCLFSLECRPVPTAGGLPVVRLGLETDWDAVAEEPEAGRPGIGLQAVTAVDADNLMQRIDALERMVEQG